METYTPGILDTWPMVTACGCLRSSKWRSGGSVSWLQLAMEAQRGATRGQISSGLCSSLWCPPGRAQRCTDSDLQASLWLSTSQGRQGHGGFDDAQPGMLRREGEQAIVTCRRPLQPPSQGNDFEHPGSGPAARIGTLARLPVPSTFFPHPSPGASSSSRLLSPKSPALKRSSRCPSLLKHSAQTPKQ